MFPIFPRLDLGNMKFTDQRGSLYSQEGFLITHNLRRLGQNVNIDLLSYPATVRGESTPSSSHPASTADLTTASADNRWDSDEYTA